MSSIMNYYYLKVIIIFRKYGVSFTMLFMFYGKKFFPLLMLIVISVTAPVSGADKIAGLASVFSIKGEVQAQRQGAGKWVTVKNGDFLRAGDRISTSAGSSCVLKWGQGGMMKLSALTALTIDDMDKNPAAGTENTEINLYSGKIYSEVKRKPGKKSAFEVRTIAAVAGVRGTKFRVGIGDDHSTTVECVEGTVSVKGTAGGEVLLQAGEKSSVARKGFPQPPARMSEDELKELLSIEEPEGARLIITAPSGDVDTGVSPLTVTGNASPGAAVLVNGAETAADASGGFSASVDLLEGVNHIRVETTDSNGASMEKSFTVKYIPGGAAETARTTGINAALLTVTSPADNLITREAAVNVAGRAKPGATLTIDDNAAVMDSNSGTFNVPLSLSEGENSIIVTARSGEDVQTVRRKVTVDTKAPVIIVTQPAGPTFGPGTGGCAYNGGILQCTVTGRTEPDALLTVNNIRGRLNQDGSFTQTVRLTSPGDVIEISATDAAGNRSAVLLSRAIDRNRIEKLQVSVSPGVLIANGQNTAMITVRTLNFFGEPVSGEVSLSATFGGSLSSSTLLSAGGFGIVTFTAGIGGTMNTVTITAMSGGVSSSTTLTLLPDIPPQH